MNTPELPPPPPRARGISTRAILPFAIVVALLMTWGLFHPGWWSP
jgi:hypothetical protein